MRLDSAGIFTMFRIVPPLSVFPAAVGSDSVVGAIGARIVHAFQKNALALLPMLHTHTHTQSKGWTVLREHVLRPRGNGQHFREWCRPYCIVRMIVLCSLG